MTRFLVSLLLCITPSLAAGAEAPYIRLEPVPQRIQAGSPTALATTIPDATVTVQWFQNGTPVPGATQARHDIPHTFPEHAGSYHVVLTNEAGTARSRQAEITVVNPPPGPGVLDLTFGPLAIEGKTVSTIVALPDGRTAIGGEFTFTGTTITNFALLDENGTPDPNTPTFPAPVRALALLPGNLLAIGGSFPQRLTYLDLTTGTTTPGQATSPVLSLLPHQGNLLIGTLAGLSSSAGGSPWITGRSITALTRTQSGTIIAASSSAPYLTTLGPSGNLIETLGQPNGAVSSLAPFGENFAAGGNFVNAPQNQRNFVTFDSNNLPLPSPAAFNARVRTLLATPEGHLIAGGNFDCVGTFAPTPRCIAGLGTVSLARLTPTGIPDLSFDPLGFDDDVHTLALTPSGKLLVGGSFDLPFPLLARLHLQDSALPDIIQPSPPRNTSPKPGTPQILTSSPVSGPIAPDDTTFFQFQNISAGASTIEDIRLHLDIAHPDTSDLELSLIPPGKPRIEIFQLRDDGRIRTSSRDLRQLTIALSSPLQVTRALAPFTGTYTGKNSLLPLRSTSPNGTWQLRIRDRRTAQEATLRSAILEFAFTPPEIKPTDPLPFLPRIEAPGQFIHQAWTSNTIPYTYETSNDLTTWHPATPTLHQTHRHPGTTEERVFTNFPGRFIRVSVE